MKMEVEKYLKWSILDELYNEKGEKFADSILKKMKEQNKELKTVNVDEELTNKIKEYVTDNEKQKELLRLVNKYEISTNADDDFWNKMYYKLGIYDGIELKNMIKTEIKDNNEDNTIFFDEYSDDF